MRNAIQKFAAAIAGFVLAAGLTAAPGAAFAAKAEVYTGLLNKTAVGGYDAVSFFTGASVKGVAAHQVVYKGATYNFASAENAAKFKANPSAYAPQYGGYRAWAAAQGYTAPGDPKFSKIVNGKLYLNYNGDVQKKWEKDIPGFIAKGDVNWPSILKK